MDNRKIVIYVAIIFIFSSCSKLSNPKERNTISFKNNIDSVLNTMGKMNYILDSSSINEYFFYAIDKDILYVKGVYNKSQKVGFISDTILYKNEALSFIDTHKRKEFVKLSIFLDQNFLDRCDYENGKYIYLYRANIYMADRQKDLMRYVILANDIKEIDLNKYKVLDNKGSLFLLADKDAEIWEN